MIDRFERFSYCIAEISKYWRKLATEEMEKYGLKGTHSVYLTTLEKYSESGLTATQLCELCARDKADVSRMISIMEEKGLVEKKGANQYRGVFKLTEKGHAASEGLRKRIEKAVEFSGKDLSVEDRKVFYEALESIVTNLRQLSMTGIPNE